MALLLCVPVLIPPASSSLSQARRGTHFVTDDALRVVHILRDHQAHFPHKKDCGELVVGVITVLPPRERQGAALSASDGLTARLVAQSSPALKHCSRCSLDACQRLTYGNPDA